MKWVLFTFVLMSLLVAAAYMQMTKQMESPSESRSVSTSADASPRNPAATDLDTALGNARTSKKLAFIKFGRPGCGICRRVQKMIDSDQIPIPESKFVFADINCDDETQMKAFFTRFPMTGDLLPFIVIADEQGRMLASRWGNGSGEDFAKLLADADSAHAGGKYVAAPTPQQPESVQTPATAPATVSSPPTQGGQAKRYY